jgi:plastocyanin
MKLHRRVFTKFLAALGVSAAVPALAKAKTVEVLIKHTPSMSFSPATVTINPGDTVNWTNPYPIGHTVTFDPAQAQTASNVVLPAGVAPFGSDNLDADGTYSHTFTEKGSYQYVCKYHEEMGMIAKVIVA